MYFFQEKATLKASMSKQTKKSLSRGPPNNIITFL